jgi:hypothetical protein
MRGLRQTASAQQILLLLARLMRDLVGVDMHAQPPLVMALWIGAGLLLLAVFREAEATSPRLATA